MKRATVFLLIAAWLACGYVGAALWSGHFYSKYGSSGIETKGSAARSSITLVVFGPVYLFVEFAESDYPPMWDWPKHLFEYEVGK